jgi:hypothetical protein
MSNERSHGQVSALKKRADELRGLSGVSPDALAQARSAGREAAEAGVKKATAVSPAQLGTLSPRPTPLQQPSQEDTSVRAKGKVIESQQAPPATATKTLAASPEEKKVAQVGSSNLQQVAQKMREQNVKSQDVALGPTGPAPTPTPQRKRDGPTR